MSHSTAMYPALRVLEQQTPPLKYGNPPYWRAPLAQLGEGAEVYVPSWNWHSPTEVPEGEAITHLDVIGAYLASIGSAQIAHSELERVGDIKYLGTGQVIPGYYRITNPYWAFSGTIVHPLGNSTRVQTEDTLWVAGPTLNLLLELERDGHIGEFEVLDSWIARRTTNFLKWADRLRSVRGECLDRLVLAQDEDQFEMEQRRYDAFKQGYAAALSMMLTGEKCRTHRPDWAHTVYAQHAASTWRKAWRYTFSGRPVVSMGAVDEIAVFSQDIPTVMALPKKPFRIDPSGRHPGALKPKKVSFAIEVERVLNAVATGDDYEDIS